jgi:hypothetical protein
VQTPKSMEDSRVSFKEILYYCRTSEVINTRCPSVLVPVVVSLSSMGSCHRRCRLPRLHQSAVSGARSTRVTILTANAVTPSLLCDFNQDMPIRSHLNTNLHVRLSDGFWPCLTTSTWSPHSYDLSVYCTPIVIYRG